MVEMICLLGGNASLLFLGLFRFWSHVCRCSSSSKKLSLRGRNLRDASSPSPELPRTSPRPSNGNDLSPGRYIGSSALFFMFVLTFGISSSSKKLSLRGRNLRDASSNASPEVTRTSPRPSAAESNVGR